MNNKNINHKCAYCGKDAHFQLKNGKWCCSDSYNKCPSIRHKNSLGLKKAYKENRCGICNLSEESLKRVKEGQIKGLTKIRKSLVEKAFKKGSGVCRSALAKYMVKDLGIEYKCVRCGLSSWLGKEIHLQLHHKDGDGYNNEISNLELLCPNCHSQTENYTGKNKNTGKIKVSDEEFINVLKQSKNIRQALLKLGLDPKGGNYIRAYKLKLKLKEK